MPSPDAAVREARPKSAVDPVLVAIRMGYGHLRPAHALSGVLATQVLEADQPPLCDEEEREIWLRVRKTYESTTRISQLPVVGAPLRALVNSITDIQPLHPYRDLSRKTFGVRLLARRIRQGLGRGLVDFLQESGRPLLTTYFVPAITADVNGCKNLYCVVTDSDINRIWAPPDSRNTNIQYCAPSQRVVRRLQAYGVPSDHIHYTGFPLPEELLGGEELPVLRSNLAARLARLDPTGVFMETFGRDLEHFVGPIPEDQRGRPVHITYAVGGAGAQTEVAARFLPGFKRDLRAHKIRITLVAGVREDVRDHLRRILERVGLWEQVGTGTIDVLYEPDYDSYFRRFNELLAQTDVLWTKPSEITFFGALGLALVLSRPVGVHERYNRRWAREHGAALKQRDPRYASQWIREWLEDGKLASAAFSGYLRLPKFGVYRIRELLER